MSRYVICSADDPQWKAERHKRITGSDAAVLLGCAPYPSDMSDEEKLDNLLHTKGSLSPEEANERFLTEVAGKEYIINYGKVYEWWELALFKYLTGAEVWATHAFVGNTSYPGMGATLDGLVSFDGTQPPADIPCTPVELPSGPVGAISDHEWGDLATETTAAFWGRVGPLKGIGILEVKTMGEWVFKGSKKRPGFVEQPPAQYEAQVQHQLAVTELPWALLIGTGARDRRAHVIQPDTFMHEELKSKTRWFLKTLGRTNRR